MTSILGHIDNQCTRENIPKIGYDAVRLRCLNVSAEQVAEGLLGKRGYHNALRPVCAKHATLRCEIPGLLAHVDSTQFDARLWAASPLGSILDCPWLYVIYDECCSRALGMWIGFGKSDRYALALAIRDAARRQLSLSPYFFSDRGAEYGSIWWEQYLAEGYIAKYSRPPGAPRFGGIQESCLKQINCQIAHQLSGSTWADQRSRQASGEKKSRATARLAFDLVMQEVRHFLFEEWNKTGHGTADASPDELWSDGADRYGDVGRPIKLDLAFLISTSIPVQAELGDRKGIRVGHREYWNDELNALRKPFRLDECRLDPGSPTHLYVKVKNQWFVTKSGDDSAVITLSPEGKSLENYRFRQNAAVNRGGQRSSRERIAARVETLEMSHAASPESTPKSKPQKQPPAPEADVAINLDKYADLPFLTS